MPRDPNMLQNIDLLSSFVEKNGTNIDNIAKQNQSNNPNFSYLFESKPDTEAAMERLYYEWKKNALHATYHPQHEFQASSLSNDCGNFKRDDAQMEVSKLLNQGSISNEEVDMDIEGIVAIL